PNVVHLDSISITGPIRDDEMAYPRMRANTMLLRLLRTIGEMRCPPRPVWLLRAAGVRPRHRAAEKRDELPQPAFSTQQGSCPSTRRLCGSEPPDISKGARRRHAPCLLAAKNGRLERNRLFERPDVRQKRVS